VFDTDGYTFTFVNHIHADTYVYRVVREPLSLDVSFHAVYADVSCCMDSTLDLVHFVWSHFERFHFVKYAVCLALLDPVTEPSTGTVMCLQHHSAEGEGLRDAAGCRPCARRARRVLQPVASCVRPATPCFYSLCLRDPPTLFNLASETLFAQVVDVHRFRLTANTTHQEYVWAVRSGKVGYARLVLPT
jgi:hypothetical protein